MHSESLRVVEAYPGLLQEVSVLFGVIVPEEGVVAEFHTWNLS